MSENGDPPENLPGANQIRQGVFLLLAVLSLVSLFLGIAVWLHGRTDRRTAYEQWAVPLRMADGYSCELAFSPQGRRSFLVWLVLDRHHAVTDDAIDRVLTGPHEGLRLEWTIASEAHLRASGTLPSVAASNRFFTQGTRGLCLGQFRVESPGPWQLRARVAQARKNIEAAKPRLEIRTHFAESKAAGIRGAASLMVGGILLGAAVIFGAAAWTVRAKKA
jgi:hypothetical protein